MQFRICIISSNLFLVGLTGCSPLPKDYDIQEGDVLFQSLKMNPLVYAIEGVTQSPYSHCGFVVDREGEWYVLEAIGPVKETPIEAWIKQGRGKRFWAYRLDKDIQARTPEILTSARKHKGKNYDIQYRFDNEEIYCSELIFSAIKDVTGIAVGKIETLGDLNWKPYEDTIVGIQGFVPLNRQMITPASLAAAPELSLVYSSGN